MNHANRLAAINRPIKSEINVFEDLLMTTTPDAFDDPLALVAMECDFLESRGVHTKGLSEMAVIALAAAKEDELEESAYYEQQQELEGRLESLGITVDPSDAYDKLDNLTDLWIALKDVIAQAKADGISPRECWAIAAAVCDEVNPAPRQSQSIPVDPDSPETYTDIPF